jgi:hypothetical protein
MPQFRAVMDLVQTGVLELTRLCAYEHSRVISRQFQDPRLALQQKAFDRK